MPCLAQGKQSICSTEPKQQKGGPSAPLGDAPGAQGSAPPSSAPAPSQPLSLPRTTRTQPAGPSTDLYPQLGRLSPRRATITGSLQPWAQTPAPPGEAHRRLPELGWSRVVVPGGGSCPQPCPGHAPSRCSCRDKALQGAQGRRAGGASPCRGGTGSWAGPTPLRVPSAGPHDWDKSP